MLLEEENMCAFGTSQRSPHKSTKVVYIVTDTCYATPADFDQGKGTTLIDSVHTSARAANVRAKKIMYARSTPGDNASDSNSNSEKCEIDQDKIIEEMKLGLYTAIGVGGDEKGGCYARKCEVEAKPIDIEDDGSSEEERDGDDWNMG